MKPSIHSIVPALVVTGPSPELVGGQVRHVQILRQIAAEAGVDFSFVPIGARTSDRHAGHRLLRLVDDGLQLFRRVRALKAEGHGRVIVHLNSSVQTASLLREAWMILCARLARSAAVLIQFHGCLLVDPEQGPWRLRALCHRIIAVVDLAVVLSAHQRAAIAWPGRTPVVVMPNGIEVLPLHDAPRVTDRPVSADRHDVLRLLFVGRVTAEKGLAIVIEAIRMLRTRGRHVTLTIVGEGDATGSIEALASQYDLGEDLIWRGALPAASIRPVMLEHDLLVFPSVVPEGVPYVLLESLEAGLPVVSTVTSGPVAELLESADGAIVAADPDGGSFAAVIDRLMTDGLLAELGARGRRAAMRQFSIASLVPRWTRTWLIDSDAGQGREPLVDES